MNSFSAVSLWEQAVRLLQEGPGQEQPGTFTDSSEVDESLCDSMLVMQIRLQALPPQPKAVWKMLVKHKVCVGTAVMGGGQG